MSLPITLDRENKTARTILFIVCFLSCMFGGVVSTLMSVYLPIAVKDLLGSRNADELNSISAFINAVFILGWAIGGFTWGIISDSVGRKKALIYAIGTFAIATILTGMAPTWELIVLCRFLTGFGVGGVLVISFTMLSEVWTPNTKAIFIGFLSISIPVGIFSAGAINYFVASWRQGFLIGLIPLSVAIISALLPEPEAWKKIFSEEKVEGNKIAALFSDTHRSNLVKGSVIFGTMLIGLWAVFSWLPTWIQSLIPGIDAQKERGLSMMLLGMGGLTGGFVSGWFIKLVGIKKSMLLCFAVCTVLSVIMFSTNSTVTPVLYAEIAVLAFFFGVSQGVLSAYIPQLFPVSIRATATGFCFNIGRIFTAIAVLFVGVLVSTLGGYSNALLIFSLIFFIGLLMVLFFERAPAPSALSNA
ncbi:MAG: MFS transporter [Agriterribacter sp.]